MGCTGDKNDFYAGTDIDFIGACTLALKGTGMDWRDRRLISKLYMDQSVKMELD